MLAAGVTSVAGLALAFSGNYLGALLDVPAVPAAMVFLVLVALLNARGIEDSLRANVVMTVVEDGGLLLEVVRVADVGLPSWLYSLVALIAAANGALLTAIMCSRLTYGMASEGLLPPVLARVLPGRRTPWVAIVVTTLVSMALVLSGDLATLAATVVLLLLIVFVSTNVAVLVLRMDRVEHAHFRGPTVPPVLGVLASLALLTQQEAGVWVRAAVLLAVGVVLQPSRGGRPGGRSSEST